MLGIALGSLAALALLALLARPRSPPVHGKSDGPLEAPTGTLEEVAGEVVADGLDAVARLAISEHGVRWRRKGRAGIEWREDERAVTARAFVIRTLAGDVEVDTTSLALRTPSLTPVDTGPLARRLVASIFPGEHVVAIGTLRRSGGYRDGSRPALLASTGRIILTVSATPPPPSEAPARR